MCGIRRWVFLPSLFADIQALVISRGGDAMSLALNAVAILFLLELDNVLYAIGLAERVRSRIETAGRVELDGTEMKSLAISKTAYTLIIPSMFLLCLRQFLSKCTEITDKSFAQTGVKFPGILIFWLFVSPFLANYISSCVQVVAASGSPVDITKGILGNFVLSIAGFITFMILQSAAGGTA